MRWSCSYLGAGEGRVLVEAGGFSRTSWAVAGGRIRPLSPIPTPIPRLSRPKEAARVCQFMFVVLRLREGAPPWQEKFAAARRGSDSGKEGHRGNYQRPKPRSSQKPATRPGGRWA